MYCFSFSRVLLGGLAASTARAVIETPLELAKVRYFQRLFVIVSPLLNEGNPVHNTLLNHDQKREK